MTTSMDVDRVCGKISVALRRSGVPTKPWCDESGKRVKQIATGYKKYVLNDFNVLFGNPSEDKSICFWTTDKIRISLDHRSNHLTIYVSEVH